jgi:hypothetical protein
MALDLRTIAELEKKKASRTSTRAAPVATESCQMPFKLLLTREQITKATKIAELRRRYRCQNCGSPHAARFAPWRLGGSTGAASTIPTGWGDD